VMLDTELKREYQQFLQEHRRHRPRSRDRTVGCLEETRAGR
jgi:hypothetical protein